MNIINAIILGVIQGLTEFLPVSSSGHLVLFQKIFGIEEPALLFDTMLHVGTLAAVFAVLWADIWAILRKLNQPLTAYLIIATIPAVIFALVFKKPLEKAFETGQFLGLCFLLTSALLIMAELLSKRAATGGAAHLKKANEMNWLDALIIGILQAVAIIPGVSRSGATLSGALSRRLDRNFAARFSFLLSIPAILGAAVLQLKDLVKGGEAVAGGGIGTAAIIAGTLSAAIVGFFAVRLMLKIVREKSLWGFALYTGIIGLLVLVDQLVTHLVF
ncbi:MAG: undecaprenyl-diphosphate phosphatase [Treponema sp.]|jgi:undecaprenyl-diphosphatase|nr:undecaprenyl-diphosphate phosphatase [Treponema sp.]